MSHSGAIAFTYPYEVRRRSEIRFARQNQSFDRCAAVARGA